MLVLRELLCGSTRFNDLRRGVPRMSPTLLSKRLKELEALGVVRSDPTGQPGVNDYRLTAAGEDLRPLVMGLGIWGHQWLEETMALQKLDPTLLMWDMHRGIKATLFPAGRSTVQFSYPDMEENHREYWLVVTDGDVEVCWVSPGYDVACFVLRCGAQWIGRGTPCGSAGDRGPCPRGASRGAGVGRGRGRGHAARRARRRGWTPA